MAGGNCVYTKHKQTIRCRCVFDVAMWITNTYSTFATCDNISYSTTTCAYSFEGRAEEGKDS